MSFFTDLRIALRSLSKDPGFTAVAVLTFALAIGANTSIFTIINTVLLRPLPWREPQCLVQVREANQRFTGTLSWPNFIDLRRQNTSFEGLTAFTYGDLTLHAGSTPERLAASSVSWEFFKVLGIDPLLGRTFVNGEDQAGADRVVVLAEGLWRTDFASDRAILGRKIVLNGEPYTVVGVVPEWHTYPLRTVRAWVPLLPDAKEAGVRGDHFLSVIGRLKPNVSLPEAQQEATLIGNQIAQAYPEDQKDRTFLLTDLRELLVGDTRPTLVALLGAVGFVLLIACANVANLLLARSTKRRRETAIRLALGASHMQLLKQFVAEGMVLALLGGLLGVILAKVGLASLIAWAALYLPRAQEVSLDWRVLGFSIALSLLTGLLCGVAPALQSSRGDVQDALKQGGTSSGSPQSNWVTGLLAVSEVAVALVLLVGAGLLIKSVLRVENVDPGFATEHVVTTKLSLPEHSYTPEAAGRFYQQLLHRIEGFPGVQAAGVISFLPMDQWGMNGSLNIEGVPPSDDPKWAIEMRYVSPDFFRALSVPLVRGRFFTESDFGSNARVILINQKLAQMIRTYRDPMGLQVRQDASSKQDPHTIVGIVGDVHQSGLDEPVRPEVYMLNDRSMNMFTINTMNLVVRTSGDPAAVLQAIRHEVSSMDPDLATYSTQTMEAVLDKSMAGRRFTRTLMIIFAALGTVLAVMGIYSVLSYLVTQHTREIGIRLALGASPIQVIRMVLNEGVLVGTIGLAVGLASSLALTRLLSGMLYGVKSYDAATFAGAATLLFSVVLLAAYVPARRTTKVDPMIALRQD